MAADILKGRHTADLTPLGDEVVVFLIGMRINKVWKLRSWWMVFSAMPVMLKHLTKHPEKGLLGYRQALLPHPTVVQYWRSFEDLERFARDADDPHLEPWRKFNRMVGASGDVGIWHETYRVPVDHIETIYSNMPAYGLAAATAAIPVPAGRTAAQRIGARAADAAPIESY